MLSTPQNETEFSTMCDALASNDRSVLAISTNAEDCPTGHGHRLGTALLAQGNPLIISLELNLSSFLSQEKCTIITAEDGTDNMYSVYAYVINETTPLRQWILQTPSATNIYRLQAVRLSNNDDELLGDDIVKLLQHCIVHALHDSPNLRVFESSVNFPLAEYTLFLQASQRLRTFTIIVPENESDADIESFAAAVSAHGALVTLAIRTADARRLLRGLAPRNQSELHPPLSPHLPTASVLRELTIDFKSNVIDEEMASLLSSVLPRFAQLKEVGLKNAQMERDAWSIVATGLAGHPSIDTLKLQNVQFGREAAALFVESMQSPHSPSSSATAGATTTVTTLQNVTSLHISRCQFVMIPGQPVYEVTCGSQLAQMVCGASQLSHLTFDFGFVSELGRADFYSILSRTKRIALRSMQINDVDNYDKLRDLERYIVNTVHLEKLTVDLRLVDRTGSMFVPTSFLSSLRRNASLHNVVLEHQGRGLDPSATVARYMGSITTRNRLLPKMMATVAFDSAILDTTGSSTAKDNSVAAANTSIGSGHPEAEVPVPVATYENLPTLCLASTPAERMAPNTVLIGLLRGSDKLEGQRMGRGGRRRCRRDGKRAHGEH